MADIYVATTGSDTTGTGAAGNPYASPGKAAGVKTTADDVWVKSGTYTLTTATANASGGPVSDAVGGTAWAHVGGWRGYQTTIGDRGTPPVVSAGAITGVTIFTLSGNNGEFDNLTADGNGGAGNSGFSVGGVICGVSRCTALNCPAVGVTFSSDRGHIFLCRAGACGTGFSLTNTQTRAVGCVSHGNASHGFFAGSEVSVTHTDCLAYANGGSGFAATTGSPQYFNCTSHGNASDGFGGALAYSSLLANCLATSNGGYGFNSADAGFGVNQIVNCAGRNNTSGNTSTAYATRNTGFVTLTVDPFVNAAGGNFALNATAGGGAACRAASILGVFPGGLTTGYADIGAVQSQSGGGGGGGGGYCSLQGVG